MFGEKRAGIFLAELPDRLPIHFYWMSLRKRPKTLTKYSKNVTKRHSNKSTQNIAQRFPVACDFSWFVMMEPKTVFLNLWRKETVRCSTMSFKHVQRSCNGCVKQSKGLSVFYGFELLRIRRYFGSLPLVPLGATGPHCF